MIKNTTVLSKKDLEFAAKQRLKTPATAVMLTVIAVCGILLLFLGGKTAASMSNSDKTAGKIFMILFCFAAGALFIGFVLFFGKFKTAMALKQPSVRAPREYEFSDDSVLCRIAADGVNAEECYSYSKIDKVFEANGALYLRFKLDNRRMFIAVHNDSYTEGSKAELAELLESKGVSK